MAKSELAEMLEVATYSLFKDLLSITPQNLNISEYSQRYLQGKLKNLESELRRDAYIIGSVLGQCKKRLG